MHSLLKPLTTSLLLLSMAALLAACPAADNKTVSPEGGKAPGPPGSAAAGKAPDSAANPSYTVLLDDVDKRIEGMRQMVQQAPQDDWLTREHLASLLTERAGLSNDFGDYVEIQKTLDEAFANAPKGSGPTFLAAHFNYSIHRIHNVEPWLAMYERRIGLGDSERGDIAMLRGDIAYHSSDYARAFKLYRESMRLYPDLQSLTRLSDYYWRTDGFSEGMGLLLLAERDYVQPSEHQLRAWLFVQMGSMYLEAGRYEDALKQYQRADVEVPDWWMVREHIAKVYDYQGRTDEAIALYEQCIQQCGHPDEMDELAGLYAKKGDQARADELAAQAGAEWERRLSELPEAALGHMINHELKFDKDMGKVVQIAERNLAARPTGLAYVKLAQAYFKAGRTDDARRIVDQALATPYSTAALFGIASKVYATQGDSAKAEQYKRECLRLNPRYPGMGQKEQQGGAAVAAGGTGGGGSAQGTAADDPSALGSPGGA